MAKLIFSNMSLGVLEARITEALHGKAFWGDLEISLEEYECLRQRLVTEIEQGVPIVSLCEEYPVCVTTAMVFMIRYKFNVNFWELFCEELCVTLTEPARPPVGNCALNTFEKFGFDTSSVTSARIYLDPLIYEAGMPPDSCIDDLFYAIKNDDNPVFDPTALIDDLLGIRSYLIRKPLRHFLEQSETSRAIDYVLEIHDTIEVSDSNPYMEATSPIQKRYLNWKEDEKKKDRSASRKKSEQQVKPFLSFEHDGRGLCMVLPRTVLKDEWVQEVVWEITGEDGLCKSVRCQVFGDEGQRYTKPFLIGVHPSASYNVTMVDDEQIDNQELLSFKEVTGVSNQNVTLFNSNGRMIRQGNHLPTPFCTMIASVGTLITGSENLEIQRQAYPNESSNYQYFELLSTGPGASLHYGIGSQSFVLNAQPHLDVHGDGQTLFSLDVASFDVPLFVEFPQLVIKAESANQLNGLELRMGSISHMLENIPQSSTLCIPLSEIEGMSMQYGHYSIKLYKDNSFAKLFEFYYVPEIETDYQPLLRWPNPSAKGNDITYHFTNTEECKVDFPECSIQQTGNDISVKVRHYVGCIGGTLSYKAGSIEFSKSFQLPMQPYSISFMEENSGELLGIDALKKVEGQEAFCASRRWLFIKAFANYKLEPVSILLKSANGIEQAEQIRLSSDGTGKIDLTMFHDTAMATALPARLELCCNEHEDMCIPLITIIETAEFKKRPQYAPKHKLLVLSSEDATSDLSVKRFGVGYEAQTLSVAGSRLNKTCTVRGYACGAELTKGIYSVTGSINNSIFDISADAFELTKSTSSFLVSSRDLGSKCFTAEDWLDELIQAIFNYHSSTDTAIAKFTKICEALREALPSIPQADLSTLDVEMLVALAYFSVEEKARVKKREIETCMQSFSRTLLDDKGRAGIVRMLVSLECSEDIFDNCLQLYALYLARFSEKGEDLSALAQKVDPYSKELALLMLLRGGASCKETLGRYHDLIGNDAIFYMLQAPEAATAEEKKKELAGFLRDLPCHVSVRITKELTGDMSDIHQMFESSSFDVKFNISKKPDSGVYFDQIRYVDQYVNWELQHKDIRDDNNPQKKLMLDTALQAKESIKAGTRFVQHDSALSSLWGDYASAMKSRQTESCMDCLVNSMPRFFYLQGMSAFFSLLPQNSGVDVLDSACKSAKHFMAIATVIAPRMARRDLLMAATYLYLKKKVNELCQ